MYYLISNKDELSHHGILGMKWGVRRYQNKDGTLTEEGKSHYGVIERLTSAGNKAKTLISNYKVNRAVKTGKVRKLSDEELSKAIDRINLEKKFKDAYRDINTINKGKGVVSEILSNGAKTLASRAFTEMANKIFAKKLTKYEEAKRDAEYEGNKSKILDEKIKQDSKEKKLRDIEQTNREDERINKVQEKEYQKWLKEHSK